MVEELRGEGETQVTAGSGWRWIVEADMPVIDPADKWQFIPQATICRLLGGISFKEAVRR
ncbi:hypothetical protein ACNKHK_18455 [Shigella flexneri]